jgi:hypothetical protein
MNWKRFRSGHVIIGAFALHLPGGTQENNGKLPSGYSVARPRFELEPPEYKARALRLRRLAMYFLEGDEGKQKNAASQYFD